MISGITGIRRSSLPFRYLGCNLYTGRCKKIHFSNLVQNVRTKLDGWKAKLLSSRGRLILIRHVLQALPIHTFAALNPPLGVLRELEGFFSKFFWASSPDQPRRIWRRWDWLTYSIQENGVGVRKLEDIWKAFSCKLWWKIHCAQGIWATYVRAITWERSAIAPRLRVSKQLFDSHMMLHVRDGSSFSGIHHGFTLILCGPSFWRIIRLHRVYGRFTMTVCGTLLSFGPILFLIYFGRS